MDLIACELVVDPRGTWMLRTQKIRIVDIESLENSWDEKD